MENIANSTEQIADPKPKLRWYQYSLRSLFILTFLVAVASSWFAVKMRQARRQKETVEFVLKLGGQLSYDYEFDSSGSQILGAKPFGPIWLRNLLGDDLFTNVTQIALSGSKVTDTDLEQFKGLKQLQLLMLAETQVTDAGLYHLKGLKQLEYLDLRGTKVTDAGMEHLEGLNQLKGFLIGNTQVTDAGLEYLKGMTKLRRIYIEQSHFTDDSVAKLQKALPNLKIEREKP